MCAIGREKDDQDDNDVDDNDDRVYNEHLE